MELDPRFEWVVVKSFDGHEEYLKVGCHHLNVVTVESVTGEVVAQLCIDCDEQLPAPRVADLWQTEENSEHLRTTEK